MDQPLQLRAMHLGVGRRGITQSLLAGGVAAQPTRRAIDSMGVALGVFGRADASAALSAHR